QKRPPPSPRRALPTARNRGRRGFITLLGGAAGGPLGGPTILAACPIVFCHLQLAARRSAPEPPHREVTSPQAMAPCAACAPSGGPRRPPRASVGCLVSDAPAA